MPPKLLPIASSVAALVLAVCLGQPARAQDASDSAAYRALTQTPPGAFTPAVDIAMTAHRGGGLTVSGQYGLQSFRSNDYIHNFGGGVQLPLAAGRIGLTIGRYNPTCPRRDCPGHLMVSADYAQNLTVIGLGRRDEAATLNVGLQTAIGYAHPGAALLSGSAAVPIALIPRQHGFRLFPFLIPGVGVGLTDKGNDTDAGMLPEFALGVGLLALEDRLTVAAGASRVFMEDGNWVAGMAVRWATTR